MRDTISSAQRPTQCQGSNLEFLLPEQVSAKTKWYKSILRFGSHHSTLKDRCYIMSNMMSFSRQQNSLIFLVRCQIFSYEVNCHYCLNLNEDSGPSLKLSDFSFIFCKMGIGIFISFLDSMFIYMFKLNQKSVLILNLILNSTKNLFYVFAYQNKCYEKQEKLNRYTCSKEIFFFFFEN